MNPELHNKDEDRPTDAPTTAVIEDIHESVIKTLKLSNMIFFKHISVMFINNKYLINSVSKPTTLRKFLNNTQTVDH